MRRYVKHFPASSTDDRISRRDALLRSAAGLGSIALGTLLAADRPQAIAPNGGVRSVRRSRAKSIIYLFMAGAPSQLDLFDEKPELRRLDGEAVPESFIKGERFAFLKGTPNLLASRYRFARHGTSQATLSELLPETARIADRIAFVKSMVTEEFNHVPAQLLLNTGSPRQGRPSMGSWLSYGLGSANQDLPAFIVLASGKASRCGTTCWSSGFLPSVHQGVQFRSSGDPVLFLSNPEGIDADLRRKSLDALRDLNGEASARAQDPEIATRIAAYELAFRMQTSVPELTDIAKETAEVHALYGTTPGKTSFANNCLLARRLVERGARFVQLYHGGWDHHGGGGDQNLVTDLPNRCLQVDRAAAALIQDLDRRGLLESTVVVFGGEFGRTPMVQGDTKDPKILGRDHQRTAFTIWLAGAGLKQGFTLGATDDLGIRAIEDPVGIHDLQATLLHLLGIDHLNLTFRHQGRDFRLTDVGGTVVEKLLS